MPKHPIIPPKFDVATLRVVREYMAGFAFRPDHAPRLDRTLGQIVTSLQATLLADDVTLWAPDHGPEGAEVADGSRWQAAYSTLPSDVLRAIGEEQLAPAGAWRPPTVEASFVRDLAAAERPQGAWSAAVLAGRGVQWLWHLPLRAVSQRLHTPDNVVAVAELAFRDAPHAAAIHPEALALCAELAAKAIERTLWTEQDLVIREVFSVLDLMDADRFTAMDRLARVIAEALHFEACTILLADDHGQHLQIVGSTGIESPLPRRSMKFSYDHSCSGWVARERRVLAVEDLDTCPHHTGSKFSDIVSTKSMRQYLGAPLVSASDALLGVVRLRNKRAPASPNTPDPAAAHAGPRGLTLLDQVRIDRVGRVIAPLLAAMLRERRTASTLERVRHDMDVPAIMIRDSAGILLRRAPEQFAAQMEDVYQRLEDMGSLADILMVNSELMRLADLSEIRLEPEHILPLGEFVAKLCKMLSPAARRKNLAGILYNEGSFHSIPRLWLDPRIIQIVLYNLLQNAVKYSLENSLITVEGDVAKIDGQTWYQIHVKNQGIGVTDEEAKRIFESYYRSPRAAKRSGAGLGIGLSTARALVERHGGRLALTRPANPTVFTIQFPAWLANKPPPRDPVSRAQP